MTKKKKTASEQETAPPEKNKNSTAARFPIVGIGASAGGLAAFEAFFSGMPADKEPGMAFVLVQHLAPNHKSILADLVRRYTRMQVFEVEDGMAVRPNCAYIIPPNRDMAILNGTLLLLEPSSPRGMRLPIDYFFRSLAQDQREQAICIVLSGSGSDGMLGVRAIKGEGGMVMAQEPETAEYDNMPRSAIATGLVDYVLPPAEMAAQLIAYTAHAFRKTTLPAPPPPIRNEDLLKKIFILLRAQTGHDFSQYKPNTVTRRIERRMAVHQIGDLDGYVRSLQQSPAEIEALFRDLVIGVTSFFRDPEAFRALEELAIPQLCAVKSAGDDIRAWVPGCSTGEEAYSLAILFQECLKKQNQPLKVQIFASDIDSRAIETARLGAFPASIAADLSPERLSRFFSLDPSDSLYHISKEIRDLLIFSEHDVIKDPPFSKLDLISCRNLLIYLDGELQKKIIPMFHYALKPGGLLFLGTSETVGEFGDFFTSLDRKWKLYQRKEIGHETHRPPRRRFIPPLSAGGPPPRQSRTEQSEKSLSLREVTEQALLREHTPAAVIINERGEILYVHGRTGRYLEPSPGEAGMNIGKMAREGLRRQLTTSLHKAVTRQEEVRSPGLRIKTNGGFSAVTLTIRPLDATLSQAAATALFLVVFEDEPRTPEQEGHKEAGKKGGGDPSCPEEAQLATMEQELWRKEEYLKTITEALEISNQELKDSNEEMQAMNEELQATNEELETSKEEMQSVNEELSTVNNELQIKVTDLSEANNDMNNMLAGTGVGTLFVDLELRIRRFTPTISQVLNLIQSDVGRPVGHIVPNLIGYQSLTEDIGAVLDNLIPKEVEVQGGNGAWYLLRIRPYRTLENVIKGAVVTFVDITETVQARESMRRLAVVVKDSQDAVTLQDLEGRILAWNPAAEKIYGWSESEALTMNVRDRIPEGLQAEALEKMRQISRTETMSPFHTKRLTRDGRSIEVWLTASALVNEAGKVYAVATTERPVMKEQDGAR
jgi:two-component system, chemotaxis family, CheB/CheR fusion protein